MERESKQKWRKLKNNNNNTKLLMAPCLMEFKKCKIFVLCVCVREMTEINEYYDNGVPLKRQQENVLLKIKLDTYLSAQRAR